MRIVLLSDVTWGGAARACCRLLRGLHAQGVDAEWITAVGDEREGARIAGDWPRPCAWALNRLARRLPPPSRLRRRLEERFHEANLLNAVRHVPSSVVNLHNIHHLAGLRLVEQLTPLRPIVWTLHDMWALTGGCRYSYGCERYLNGCDGSDSCVAGNAPDVRRKEWTRRQLFFARNASRVTLVTPSRWLAGVARRRFGELLTVKCIPNGLSTETFKPIATRKTVRDALGLPPDGPLILTGADVVRDPRKGYRYLAEAIDLLRLEGLIVSVVSFGQVPPPAECPSGWLFSGQIRDEALLNLYYNAADAYVLPSLADNLPNTLVESIACGTPCVSFDVGGCGEVVREDATGYLAKVGSAESLAAGIKRVLRGDRGAREKMRANCRRVAEEEYALSVQATRYAELFSDVLKVSG